MVWFMHRGIWGAWLLEPGLTIKNKKASGQKKSPWLGSAGKID